MNLLDALAGRRVRLRVTHASLPSSFVIHGELLHDPTIETNSLAGWYVAVRSLELTGAGVPAIGLNLERYPRLAAAELHDPDGPLPELRFDAGTDLAFSLEVDDAA